jgi:hypothetical protein
MWEPRRFTTLLACYRNSFTLLYGLLEKHCCFSRVTWSCIQSCDHQIICRALFRCPRCQVTDPILEFPICWLHTCKAATQTFNPYQAIWSSVIMIGTRGIMDEPYLSKRQIRGLETPHPPLSLLFLIKPSTTGIFVQDNAILLPEQCRDPVIINSEDSVFESCHDTRLTWSNPSLWADTTE